VFHTDDVDGEIRVNRRVKRGKAAGKIALGQIRRG